MVYLSTLDTIIRSQHVSPVIVAFMRNWRDNLAENETHDQLLTPLIQSVIYTKTTHEDDQIRAWMATDWLIRICAPAWLRLAGFTEHADNLAALQPITNATIAKSVQVDINAARDATRYGARSHTERYAARDAAQADAALAAAIAAAMYSARAVTIATVLHVVVDAAESAVGEGENLQSTVAKLQESAQDLVRRMAEVGRTPS